MAKSRPLAKKIKKAKSSLNRIAPSSSRPVSNSTIRPHDLFTRATTCLEQGDIETAIDFAKQALQLSRGCDDSEATLSALILLGETHIELGDIDEARTFFLEAAEVDKKDAARRERGDQPEIFLWLAQVSDEGGQDSVRWYDEGTSRLRTQIRLAEEGSVRNGKDSQDARATLDTLARRLALALCSVVEVYMTDLSWEDDAEARCEALVTEATMVAAAIPEPWQTLANVRISQGRLDDARAALERSLDTWRHLTPEADGVPDFPTRISLARLLLETELEDEALEVLERLVAEDDGSVEAWYLGGWGLYIMGDKQRGASSSAPMQINGEGPAPDKESSSWQTTWTSSQQWLNRCLRLYAQQDYEDDRLGAHAQELVTTLNSEIGEEVEAAAEDDKDAWEDSSSAEEDHAMHTS